MPAIEKILLGTSKVILQLTDDATADLDLYESKFMLLVKISQKRLTNCNHPLSSLIYATNSKYSKF